MHKQGSCLCGKIQFKYIGSLTNFSFCHCKMCQKFSGTAFGTFVSLKKEKFSYIQGEDLVAVYNSSKWASRAFCKNCGSSLMYIYHEMPDTLSISVGLFDTSINAKPSKHIFVKEKCNWYEINDELPQISKF